MPNSRRHTILMTAARTGNPEIVRLLIEHGADVNAKGEAYGETALVWAAQENHAEAAQVLIAHGADVNGRTNPLERAKDRFGLEGVLTILPHGSWTPLMYAARQGSLETARALVDARSKSEPDGSRQHHRPGARDHQRPLRYGGAAGRKRRGSQYHRYRRDGRTVRRCGYEYAGRSIWPSSATHIQQSNGAGSHESPAAIMGRIPTRD